MHRLRLYCYENRETICLAIKTVQVLHNVYIIMIYCIGTEENVLYVIMGNDTSFMLPALAS